MVTGAVEIATILSLSPSFFLSFFGVSTLIYITSLHSSLPYTLTVDGLRRYLSHQPPLEVFRGDCKAVKILFKGHFLINVTRE